MSYIKELAIATTAATTAAMLCVKVQSELVGEHVIKKDKSPVTVADFGSQALVCKELRENFPDDPIVGEETSQQLREDVNLRDQVLDYVRQFSPEATTKDMLTWIDSGDSHGGKGRFWTLDPIDGTKGYIRGEQYAVGLALVEDGEVKVGVSVCPSLPHDELNGEKGIIFSAVKNEGMQAGSLDNSIQIYPLVQPVLRLVERYTSSSEDDLQTNVAKALGLIMPPLRMDSMAKYGAVALGRGVLYLRFGDPNQFIWDHAAGVIVLEEAGGRVTDKNGKPLDFSAGQRLSRNRDVVASRGIDHDKVIATINAVTK